LWSTSGPALLMNSWMGLTCYPDGSVHRFTMCFWRKSYQKRWWKSCLSVRRNTWFQHDGAAGHFALQVWEHLTTTYDCWIGQGEPMAWPPRLPDLTPMDFFIQGHIKDRIYTSPVDF
jgi:hypothetical protein